MGKSNEMAQVTFQPQQPLVVDTFKNCEGLSRIAFLDGNTAVMLGKVVSVKKKSEMPAEERAVSEAPRGARAAAGDAQAPSRVVRPFFLFMASLWHDAKGRTSVDAVCVHRR